MITIFFLRYLPSTSRIAKKKKEVKQNKRMLQIAIVDVILTVS